MLNNLVGQTLDRYKIVKHLGSGGMGAVFKGHDLSLQRDVAIKIMHPHIASQPNFQERFLQEARTAARLDHPGIVQVYDFGHDRSYLYIVMKFIAGDNLEKMLRTMQANQKWMVLTEAIETIRLVSQALDYAHHQGVLHRDIKPGNIMIEPVPTGALPYRPVITDLGLAKLAEGGVVTSDGTSMGTPAYMSPEQAMGEETDPRSDVYSLGVLLFELATGRLPFPAKTLTEAIRYHTKQPPPEPRSIRPDLPQSLEHVILKAMQKNPGERYQNAADLASALENISSDTAVALQPTAMESAVSLYTEYQNSLVEPRGASILEEFSTPAQTGRDQIQIMAADKTIRNISLKPEGLTIGREADNDIVLDDRKVSRHHARIDYDGSDYRVLDLDSSNGTFLANNRLLPGISDTWTPDKALRIGDTWLRLVRAEPGSAAGPGTRLDYSRVRSSPGEGRIGVFLEDANLAVEPGEKLEFQLVLINQGELVDHFEVSIAGIPQEWTPGLPKAVYLMPGQQEEITITLLPPRDPGSRAGRYALTINIASRADASQTTQSKATLTVATYTQFTSELRPQKIRAGQPARVIIHQRGNFQESFNLTIKDRGNELIFKPDRAQIQVAEGKSGTAEFRSEPRQRRWIGGEKIHPISVQVAASKGEPQVHPGEVISRAVLPPWVIQVALVLCVLLGAAGIFFTNRAIAVQRQATQTAVAERTGIAVVVAGTAQAQTATAEWITNSNLALTATAVWLDEDDDKDGLSNGAELNEYGTLPGVRDTDGDGLDDGQEVNTYSTSPLEPDSDGDGVKDGDEVSKGLDPKNPDTDGDGANDAQDQAPLETHTATPDTGATSDANAQQTAMAQQALDQTATVIAAATATQQAANATATEQVMACFLGNWIPTDPDGGLARLIIARVNQTTYSYHGYGDCSPTDCDWGVIEFPFSSPELVGTYHFGYKSTRITAECIPNNRLAVEVFDDYTVADGRTDRTATYTMKKDLVFLLPVTLVAPLPTIVISP